MSTYEHVHSGDVVLGHDRNLWRVVGIRHGTPQGTGYALRREDDPTAPVMVGYPPAGTEVVIIEQADTRAEFEAAGVLIAAGLMPEVIEEKWGWS